MYLFAEARKVLCSNFYKFLGRAARQTFRHDICPTAQVELRERKELRRGPPGRKGDKGERSRAKHARDPKSPHA